MNDATFTVRARWLLPVERPPIENGWMSVVNGRIAEIGSAKNRHVDRDLGDVVVLPGFVNAHTHLDLGALRGRIAPTGDFTEWLRAIVHYRQNSQPCEWRTAIHAGVAESLRSGTTLIGDISSGGWSWDALAQSPLRSVVFFELIGLKRDRARTTLSQARQWLRDHASTDRTLAGLSPHAPYSVRRSLYRWAVQRGCPVSIHLAETRDEAELLESHAGPFRLFLEEIGAWDESGLAPSWRWFLHGKAASLVHANYLDVTASASRATRRNVIYCPRTHAYFGHPPHPFREFLQAGINVALGTDSLASNPDLSILNEVRFLAERHPDVPGETLLQMATINGAKALGQGDVTGSLMPGKSADFITIVVESLSADPHQCVLYTKSHDTSVWIGGTCIEGDFRP